MKTRQLVVARVPTVRKNCKKANLFFVWRHLLVGYFEIRQRSAPVLGHVISERLDYAFGDDMPFH